MKSNNTIKHFINTMIQGLFWLLPIVATIIIISWLYTKIELLLAGLFRLIGFIPEKNLFLWEVLAIFVFLITLYILGHLARTKLANLFEYLFSKIPGYTTIRELVGIFNSSKKGKNQVLVVAVKGFGNEGYNIGLMYSQKESIIKDHYTITLSMSPIPNGGFMFEVHKEKIYVIDNATFDNNLQYLLSMGVKSFAEILRIEPKNVDEFTPLCEWIKKNAS
ncbi:DUF502 domain-containing protein [Sulfurovum sp. TSL1]|uniref:DUF502 domain-containing protein n=1 Tax=Sulfurovum sp. TSL1 TaxID=2826994 RepID=UPI001CC48D5E|nr:DUF502 domain-containing protein [Sulfurovum sp. TSL1]GIT97931.1 hypothetical protein TSL1_07520 [Sulfurovum sp. TSL1]